MTDTNPDWLPLLLALAVALYAFSSVKRGVLFDGMKRVRRIESPTYFMLMIGGFSLFALLLLGLFASSL